MNDTAKTETADGAVGVAAGWRARRRDAGGAQASPARWAWLAMPLFIALMAGLWLSGRGMQASYESTPLFLALTVVFGLLVCVLMAVLLGRSFLIHRAPELLFIAMGAVFWGSAGFGGAAAGALQGGPGYANTVATVYNVAVWLSALCHLVGAALPRRWRSPLHHPGRWLAGAYALSVTAMLGLVAATWHGMLPVFFIPGEGGTLTRELVLYSAIAMLIVTGLLFTNEQPRKGKTFKYLYGHALLLLAVGVVGLMVGGPGSLLAWAGRAAHAVGSVYMFVGVLQAGRAGREQGLLADRPADEGRLGNAVAVAVVVAAAAARVLLFPSIGERFLFTVFYPALAFAAFYAGLRAGLLATVLGALIAAYFWIAPAGTLWAKPLADWLGIGLFLATGGAISWMADRMRAAEARARLAEASVAAQRDRLDELVRARTASLEREIAERARTEDALRAKEAELSEAQRVARLGSWYWDARTDRITASDEMLQIFGRRSIPPPAEQEHALYPPDSWRRMKAAFEEACRTGIGYDIELEARRGDGERIWIEARAEVVRGAAGELAGLRGTAQDISKRVIAEKRLRESERRLSLALAAGNSAVWDMDVASGRITGDESLFAMYGYAPGDLQTTADWLALVHEDERPQVEAKVTAAIEGVQDSYSLECRLRCKDGVWRWNLLAALVTERDGRGRALRVIGTHTSIHDRKSAEESLRQERSRLQAIIDNSPLLILVKDMESRVVLANKAIFENLRVPPREKFIGHSLFQSFPPDVAEARWMKDLAAMVRDAPLRTEEAIRHRDGTWHTYVTVRFPVHDIETQELIGICAISTDISERKEAEAEVRRLNVELEQRVEQRTAELERSNEALLHSNAELKHFAHATAHDLKTPLRSIVGFAQLLHQEVDQVESDRVRDLSSRIVDNTKRLQILIEDLLAYSRLEAQGLPFEAVDLGEVIREVLASLQVLIRETGSEIRCGELPTVAADRVQIAQLFQNLIENGIKYNEAKPPVLSITGELQEDQWVFAVADNGIGIDPRHHERIFEIFRRLHAYHHIPGNGIGLALCRRIVERHGGRIWVESRPGQGSTFYFTLPARLPGEES